MLSTHNFLKVNPTFRIGHELAIVIFLLLVLFHGPLEGPAQGFCNQDLSIIHHAISTAPRLALGNTSTVPRAAVSGRVLRYRRRGHYLTVKAKPLKRWENCGSHFEGDLYNVLGVNGTT
jgi:hypothetical protein